MYWLGKMGRQAKIIAGCRQPIAGRQATSRQPRRVHGGTNLSTLGDSLRNTPGAPQSLDTTGTGANADKPGHSR